MSEGKDLGATADSRLSEERYGIVVLIGPCRKEDAEWLMERIASYVYGDDQLGHPLGAVVSMGPWQEDPPNPAVSREAAPTPMGVASKDSSPNTQDAATAAATQKGSPEDGS